MTGTSRKIVGMEIGGTKLQVALGTSDGLMLERRRAAVDRIKARKYFGLTSSAAFF